MALTDKKLLFATEYLVDFNGTQAAIRAGYSEASARAQASRLLTDVDVLAIINARKSERVASADEVLEFLTSVMRGDIGEVTDNNGNLDMIAARKKQSTRLIKRIKYKSFTTDESDVSEIEVEMYSALDAAKLLAKYHRIIDRAKEEDWRSQYVKAIQEGKVSKEALETVIGHDLATELFLIAGVNVATTP